MCAGPKCVKKKVERKEKVEKKEKVSQASSKGLSSPFKRLEKILKAWNPTKYQLIHLMDKN